MSNRKKHSRRTAFNRKPGALAMMISSAAIAQVGSAAEVRSYEVLEEVLVTAQKRTESAQDVPASISALDGDQLSQFHAVSLADYAAYVPGFNVVSGGTPGQSQITLRGIAPVSAGAVVGTYIDDTPVGSSGNRARGEQYYLDLMPYDVDHVEVLRGPQGTLYGAGAMGGLLKYVMRDPNLTDFELRTGVEGFDIRGADDRGWGVRVGVNAPLAVDRVALRASYFDQSTPGYVDSSFGTDVNDLEQRGGRAALLWQLNDDASLKLNGMWQRTDSDDNAVMSLALTGVDPPRGTPSFGDLTNTYAVPQPFDQSLDYYSATLNWNLGAATLVSATSFSQTSTRQIVDKTSTFDVLYPLFGLPPGLTTFDITLDLEKWTQELRLESGTEGKLEWLVGAYYTHEQSENVQSLYAFDTNGAPIPALTPYLVFVSIPSRYEEIAAFGDVTYKFSERFDVTAGLRWARNEQRFRQLVDGILLPPADERGESSESVVTYMVSPRWRVTDDVMLYARVASGYRPGSPQAPLLDVPQTLESDDIVNYEVGLKAELLERRAILNLAAFRIDWNDMQQFVELGGFSGLTNAGEAKSQGVELETVFLPISGLRLGLNAAYTDAALESSPRGPSDSRNNRVGEQLPNVPEWNASAVVDYTFALSSGWDAQFGAGYRYVGEQGTALVTILDDVSYRLPAYDAVDLNVGIMNDRWSIRLFAKNVTDERAYTGGGGSSSAAIINAAGVPVIIDVSILQPRTIGLSVDVTF